MRRKKSWLLVLGMTMLMGWGAASAQAAPQDFDHPPMMYAEWGADDHLPGFRQTPEEHRRMLDLLNIDERTYIWDARHGRSLAEIAEHHDVAVRKVVRLLDNQLRARINWDEREGRISPWQAREMREHAWERAEKIVHRPLGEMHNRPE